MQRDLAVIVVGAGYFANFHINAWLRLHGVKLSAIVDKDTAKHAALKDKTNGAADTLVTDSLSAALEHCAPDIIDIATPPHTHTELIREAIKRNCPLIICQKPFCGSHKAALELYNDIKPAASQVVIHENFRFQPWFRAIKAELQRESLGAVLQATFRLRPGDGQGADAYLARQPYFREMPQFLIHETGIHYIDVFRYLFGEPDALSAELRQLNPALAGEDAGHFSFYYKDGLHAHFDGNRLLDHAADNRRLTMGEMLVEGTTGSIALDGNGRLLLRRFDDKQWHEIPYRFDDNDFGADCVYLTQKHIADHLQQGTPLENTAGDYLENLRLESLVYESAASHTRMDCKP